MTSSVSRFWCWARREKYSSQRAGTDIESKAGKSAEGAGSLPLEADAGLASGAFSSAGTSRHSGTGMCWVLVVSTSVSRVPEFSPGDGAAGDGTGVGMRELRGGEASFSAGPSF